MGVDNEGFASPGSFPPTQPVEQAPAPPADATPHFSTAQPAGAPLPPSSYGHLQRPPTHGYPTPGTYVGSGQGPGFGAGQSSPYGPGSSYGPGSTHGPGSPYGSGQSAPRTSNAGLLTLCIVFALVAGLIGGVAGSFFFAPASEPVTIPTATTKPGDGSGNGDGSSSGGGGSGSGEGGGEAVLDGVAGVADAVLPSVVSIDAGISSGSGFVVRSDGYLLTNHHVIANATTKLTVTFSDGRKEDAKVIGSTGSYDVAVLKVDRDDLIPLELADSEEVRVGEQVVAIGAPLGLEGTVTTGIVSALNRPVAAGDHIDTAFINAIQTDTAINPGNSGGPLVNMSGQVVGIASAIAQVPGSSGSIGLGFAIPANQVRRTADQLIETGKATYPIVGVLLDNLYMGEGVQVLDESGGDTPAVTAGGPADLAGIKPGDVILEIDGRPVTHPNELIVAIRAKAPGDEVTLKIRPKNGSGEKELELTLDETESE